MSSNNVSQLSRILAVILISGLAAGCGEGDGPKAIIDPTPPAADAYTLVWSDEFDVDGAPNVKHWTMETGYGAASHGGPLRKETVHRLQGPVQRRDHLQRSLCLRAQRRRHAHGR